MVMSKLVLLSSLRTVENNEDILQGTLLIEPSQANLLKPIRILC